MVAMNQGNVLVETEGFTHVKQQIYKLLEKKLAEKNTTAIA